MSYLVSTSLSACRLRDGVALDDVVQALAPVIGEALGLAADAVDRNHLNVLQHRDSHWGQIRFDARRQTVSWSIRGKRVAADYLDTLKITCAGLAALSDDSFVLLHNNADQHPDGLGTPFFYAATEAAREDARNTYCVDAAIRALPDGPQRVVAANLLRMIFDRNPARFEAVWPADVAARLAAGVVTPVDAALTAGVNFDEAAEDEETFQGESMAMSF